MIQLLKHELYKIFIRKSILFTIILFLGWYALFIGNNISNARSYGAGPEYYEGFEGPVTEQKLKTAIKLNEDLKSKYSSDEVMSLEDIKKLNVYSQVISAGGNLEEYNNKLNSLNDSIKEAEARGVKDFEYKKNKLEYNMRKSVSTPKIYYIKAWANIIDFINTFGLIMMGALILLGLSPVFADEYANNMDSLILSSKNGKSKVITAKILASFIYIIAIGTLFAAINIAVNISAFGNHGWNALIQNIFKYGMSPYGLNAIQYHLVQLVIQLLGGLAFGLLVLAVSTFSRSPLIPFFVGGIVFGVPVIIKSFIKIDIRWIQEVTNFSYTSVMKVEDMFRFFKIYNVLGLPVLYLHAAIVTITLLTIASVIFIYKGFRKHQVS